uniref:Uncharacterized protein n=1 Tax=Plectus sambesii TaxID=2011161 RepID=A0A914UK24_9BILA
MSTHSKSGSRLISKYAGPVAASWIAQRSPSHTLLAPERGDSAGNKSIAVSPSRQKGDNNDIAVHTASRKIRSTTVPRSNLSQGSPDESHRSLNAAGVGVQHGQDGTSTVASILGNPPIRRFVGRRPSAIKLATNWAGMRGQHAARTVGGTGITSRPPDFGTGRRRLRRHRPEISPLPAAALLRPLEEQSPCGNENKDGGKRHDT